jgi:oligoendopeptidase F
MPHRLDAAPGAARRQSLHAADAAAGSAAPLADLPAWNLADLYPAMDSPALSRDMEQAASDAESFAARYQGKLGEIAASEGSAGLHRVLTEFEALQDLMGRIASFAYLSYVTRTDDPARAKFFGDVQEKLTNIGSKLLFLSLELNRIDDKVMDAAPQRNLTHLSTRGLV